MYVGFCFGWVFPCSSSIYRVFQTALNSKNKSRHRGNGIALKQATPRAALGFFSSNRAENLCYQFAQEQKLLPQFRKIVGLVVRLGGTPTPTKTYSERSYKRNVLIRRRNTSRNGGEQISAELASHTSPFCNDYNKLQSFAFWSLRSFFPRAKNSAFIFIAHTQVRLFLTCGSPCVCSTSDCAVLLRSRRTKRSGITRGRYLSMRVPTVFPASDG